MAPQDNEVLTPLLMTPGPVQIPQDVLQALALPMIHHRTPEFEKILKDVLQRLPKVFRTSQPVYIQSATGSGGMESALVNVLSPGDKVLSIVAGKFGERWRSQAAIFGAKVISIDVPWGDSVNVDQVRQTLEAHPDTRLVLIQACETSTAILNPLREVAAFVRHYPNCLIAVDAITALGVTELAMDDWGLDVVVAASQKAFMLPTGLAFLSFSKKAWPFVLEAKTPRSYFDIRSEDKANRGGATEFSSSVALIRGLQVVLTKYLTGDIGENVQRFEHLALVTRKAGEALGLCTFAKSPSPSVTALSLPPTIDGEKLRLNLETKHRIVVAGGQDSLKGKIIRIGHMGDVGLNEVRRTITALATELNEMGHSCDIQAALKVIV
jgi:aspartate aminotransferase-like enzyme